MNEKLYTRTRLIESILLRLFLSFISIAGSAQEELVTYSVKDGLTSSTVYSMELDHEGYLWIGTYRGLNRFDGRVFKQYYLGDNADKKSQQITDIYSDSKNRLWVSTFKGLYLYTEESDSFKKINNNKLNIGEIAEDPYGTIWAVGYGAYVYDESAQALNEVNIIGGENRKIEDILFDPRGYIWLGWYKGGLTQCTYDKLNEPEALQIKTVFNSAKDKRMKSDIVRELVLDKHHRLWFTTYAGLNWIDLNNDNLNYEVKGFSNELSDGQFWSIIQDHQGNIWAGSYGTGLFKIDSNFKNPTIINYQASSYNPVSISCNEIHSVFEDKYHNIWIGSENGLNRIVRNEITYSTYQSIPGNPNSIPSNHIFDIYQDSTDKIWLGTPEGLSVISEKQKYSKVKNYKLPGLGTWASYIYTILPGDQSNQFYIGTRGGLYNYQLGGDAERIAGIEHRSGSTITIHDIVKADQLIWVATDDGVYAFHKLKKEIVHFFDFGRQPLSCRKILLSNDGSIWLATDNGLKQLIDPKIGNNENNIKNYPLRIEGAKYFNYEITDIIEDKDLNKWIGTANGLYYYDETTRKYLEFNTKNGLLEAYVAGLLIYKNRIFVVGISTLSIINIADKSIESYYLKSVINNIKEPFYSSVLSNGKIALGGLNGLKILDPDGFSKDTNNYPLKFQDFKIANESVWPAVDRQMNEFKRISHAKRIYLDGKSNTFTIEFSSLNLSGSDNFIYKYKLDKYDKNWVYVKSSQGFANYSKLKSGSYLFRVNATNSIGQWNSQETTLEIIVLPPIWWRWYFILIYITLFILFLIFVRNELAIRYKLSTEKKISSEIKNRNEEQLRYFINISHEFKTPLSLMRGPLEYLNNNIDPSDELFKYSEWALNNAHKLTFTVNEIMDFRLLEAGKLKPSLAPVDWKELVETSFGYFEHVAEQKHISYELKNNLNQLVLIDGVMIEKTLVVLLDNAFKYSPKKGMVKLSSSIAPNYFDGSTDGIQIICSNTGSYIPPEETEKIFERFYRLKTSVAGGSGIGLSITKQFVELHNGKIWCESSEQIGVEFHIVIPLVAATNEEQVTTDNLNTIDYKRMYSVEPMGNNSATLDVVDSGEPKSRLLLVEDNDNMRNFIASVLSKQYTVLLASNGAEAMEIVKKEVYPDLIISDIMMPVMDGLALCNEIKGNTATSHIPIVLLTAKTEQYSQLDSFKHEANSYIQKPFSIELLQACIKSILRQNEVQKKYYSSILFDANKIRNEDDPDTDFVDTLKELIIKNIDNTELSIDILCHEMSLSQYMLYNKIKSITGKTPWQIIKKMRISYAEVLLKKNQYTIKEVQYMAGFSNSKSFRDAFIEEFGALPSKYLS